MDNGGPVCQNMLEFESGEMFGFSDEELWLTQAQLAEIYMGHGSSGAREFHPRSTRPMTQSSLPPLSVTML